MCSEDKVDELKDQMLELRLDVSKAMGLPAKLCSQVQIAYKVCFVVIVSAYIV